MLNPIGVAMMNEAMMSSPEADSVHDYLEHAAGEPVSKTLAIAGDGATSLNCFLLTGTVRVLQLWMDVTAVTNSTDFAVAQFDLFPTGGTAIDITGAVDGSGCLAGSMFMKIAAAATALKFVDNTLGAVTESATNKPFYPFVITKKTGAVTNVRLTFNGDADTDITATVYARYHKLSYDGALAAAA